MQTKAPQKDWNGDWNDLRFIAAVAQTGTLADAARQLRVNHATVFRRIEAVEAQLHTALFERHKGRYLPTAAGEALALAGAQMAVLAEDTVRQVAGHDLQPHGVVRVTTTDSFAHGLIAPMAAACRAAHPGIKLEVISSGEFFNLSRRDADIALRATHQVPEHLIGQRIGTLAMAVYGAKQYLRRHRSTGLTTQDLAVHDLAAHDWVALDDSLSHSSSLTWLERIKPLADVPYRTNSFLGVYWACMEGMGLAMLPCFLGDRQPALRRVTPVVKECENDLWLLTHPDLRNTVRVMAVFQALRQHLDALKPLLAGNQPQA